MSRGSETTLAVDRCAACSHSRSQHSVWGKMCWVRFDGAPEHRCLCDGFREAAPVKRCTGCGHEEYDHFIRYSTPANSAPTKEGCWAELGKCDCNGYTQTLAPLPHGLSSLISMPDFNKMTILEVETWFQRLADGGTPGADWMVKHLRRLARLETTWYQVEVLHGDIRRAIEDQAPMGWTEGK